MQDGIAHNQIIGCWIIAKVGKFKQWAYLDLSWSRVCHSLFFVTLVDRQNFKLYACWYVSQSCSFVLFYSYIQFQMLGTPFFIKIFPLLVSHSPNFFFKSLPFLKSSKFRFYWSIDIKKNLLDIVFATIQRLVLFQLNELFGTV